MLDSARPCVYNMKTTTMEVDMIILSCILFAAIAVFLYCGVKATFKEVSRG